MKSIVVSSSFVISPARQATVFRIAKRPPLLSSRSGSKLKASNTTRTTSWNESLSYITNLGLDIKEAESIVSEAYGWGSQKYWRKKKINEEPNPHQVKENLVYLQSVGFKEQHLIDLLSGFPEILACDLTDRIGPNVEYLERNFFLKGQHRVKAVLRKPRILGNIIDCEGDCKGECSRCWSQF